MSRHWKPDRSDWTLIDGDRGSSGERPGEALGFVVGAVMVGLLFGGFLAWSARQQAESMSTTPIEWNAVQKVPARMPDAQSIQR